MPHNPAWYGLGVRGQKNQVLSEGWRFWKLVEVPSPQAAHAPVGPQCFVGARNL